MDQPPAGGEEDGWIQFSIFLPPTTKVTAAKWRAECVELLLPHTEGYLWHTDSFCLRTPNPSDQDYVAPSKSAFRS